MKQLHKILTQKNHIENGIKLEYQRGSKWLTKEFSRL